MSLVYLLSKFSHEAMLVELFLISCITACYFGYLLIKKRKYGAAKKHIPDNVVRAYLMEMISHAEGFKNQLFGEDFKITPGAGLKIAIEAAPTAAPASAADAAALAALKAQVAAAVAKQDELNKTVSSLSAEKASLEAKLKAAPAAGSGDDKKQLADVQDKIGKLEAKLAEYEVIEDDLANLKKYQQENKQLRAQLAALQGGAAAPVEAAAPPPAAAPVAAAPVTEPAPAPEPAPEPVAAAPAPTPPPASEPAAASPISAAEESLTEAKAAESFEGLVDKVEESLAAPPEGASAVDPATVAQVQTAAPASDTPAPTAVAEAAPAPKSDKSDADLLSEFERMLSG